MQIDLLCEYASSLVGSAAVGIVKQLHAKRRVNEFLIAKKSGLTINQTRNILYKLADEGLVSFVRKKDKKKGGWYTYFWSLEIGKGLQKLHELLLNKANQLREHINSRTANYFYFCQSCNAEFNEENALSHDYRCSECGELLMLKDPTEELGKMGKELKLIEKQLNEVSEELGGWQKKEGKQRMRKARVEEKKKQDARKAKSMARKQTMGKKKTTKPEKSGKKKKTEKRKKTFKKNKKNVKRKSLFKLIRSHIIADALNNRKVRPHNSKRKKHEN